MRTLILLPALLLLSLVGHTHGVERGSKLQAELEARVMEKLNESCAFSRVMYRDYTVRVDEVDQGVIDRYYAIEYTVADESGELDKIVVHAADYAMSNPAFDKYEVSEPQPGSRFCR